MEALQLAKEAAKALDDKKGIDIKVLKVEDLTVLADYFVIASGTSNTHVGALADEAEARLDKLGIKPLRREGEKTRNWVLLDYGSTVIHVFYPEAREFYALDRLWADAETVPVDLT
ncbi:MAG: ribosome silencing factor [Oscillospiraceae bacterium]